MLRLIIIIYKFNIAIYKLLAYLAIMHDNLNNANRFTQF